MKLLWPASGGYSVRLYKSLQTNDFEAQPPDRRADGRLRTPSAAVCRDHPRQGPSRRSRCTGQGRRRTNARLLADAGALTAAGAVTSNGAPAAVAVGPRAAAVTPPPPWENWNQELLAVREAARRPSSISASGLEGTEPEVQFGAGRVDLGTGVTATTSIGSADEPPGLFALGDDVAGKSADGARLADPEPTADPPGAAKGPRDIELPPWSKGRYGTAVGRAVHGVLQAIDLATGEGLDQAVAAQCAAEGVAVYADIVRGCVRSALDSDIVRRASTRQHWRESFVGTVLDAGTVVEGFIDLMYREDDGTLVVVDYKTDDIPAAAIGVRAEYYRPQIHAYLGCLRASGVSVPTGVLLFLSPTRPAEARSVDAR